MSIRTRTRLLPLCAALAPVMLADAATGPPTTFQVKAQIIADCTVSATNMNFGDLGVLNADKAATSTVTATCTNTTPYSIGLDAGNTSGSSETARLLANGSNTLPFQLYKDGAYAQYWGSTTGTLASGTGNGSAQTFTVFGRIQALATTPPLGQYTTIINVTISY